MIKDFNNESWVTSEEKDFYIRTLKSIKYHKPLERFDTPTTTFLFISRLGHHSIRQHFEESSRHFKTFNTFNDLSSLFSVPEVTGKSRLHATPHWVLNLTDSLLRSKIISLILRPLLPRDYRDHFAYRESLKSLSKEELVRELSTLFHLVGLTNFSKLNALIGPANDRNVEFGIMFLCQALNDPKIKHLLSNENILIPDEYQTVFGIFNKKKNKLFFKSPTPIHHVNKHLQEYLEKKTQWVLNRKHVRDLVDVTGKRHSTTLIIGRRVLTRGNDPLNENSLIQSYDYKKDFDFKLIQKILRTFVVKFHKSDTKALIVIENSPNQISYLISRDEELKSYLHGNAIAVACIDPETRDIYTFEGDQFIQRSLKYIY